MIDRRIVALLAGLLGGYALATSALDATPIQSEILIESRYQGARNQLVLDPSLTIYYDGGVVGAIGLSSSQTIADAGFTNVSVASVTVGGGTPVTKIYSGSTDYDFQATKLSACHFSTAFAVTGAKIGDACTVGYKAPIPYDGGAASNDFQAECQVVSPGNAVIQGCCNIGDGGTCDPADAGYVCTCISVQ